MIDKSDGQGCIGCPVEKGETCEDCIHRDDIVNKSKAILAEAEEQRRHCNE